MLAQQQRSRFSSGPDGFRKIPLPNARRLRSDLPQHRPRDHHRILRSAGRDMRFSVSAFNECLSSRLRQRNFRMTSEDKGLLTAVPMLGMILGSYFWGCLADTKGRKYVLIGALLLDGNLLLEKLKE